MTTHELANMLFSLPNFELMGHVAVELSEERLSKMSYPYPFTYIDGEIELGDVGYSDSLCHLNMNIHENDLKGLITVNRRDNVMDKDKKLKNSNLPDFSGKRVYLPGDPLDGFQVVETVRNAEPDDPNSNFWVVRLKGISNLVRLYEYEMV